VPRPAQRPPPPPNSAAAIAAAAVVLPMPISPRHNHGVTARGVSAYPAAVTAQMVANFSAGGAAINQLARAADAALRVVALALDVSMFHDERVSRRTPGLFPV
jgi:NaMN:DMB phosphoribosyltransferase